MFPLFVFLLVLSGIGQSVGFAILGGHRGWRNKGAGQERRQAITPFLPPPMSTIFLGGDSSKPKTASAGYAAQVDIINDIWGFCPTSAPVQKCGLPGSCVDSHACSKGCGFTDDSSLPTITCNDYCMTALLTATSGLDPFTYLACAKSPSTEHYLAFTTKQAVTPLPVPTTTKTTSTAASTSTSTRGPTTSSAPPTTKPAISTTSPPKTSSASEPTASASSTTGSNGDINSNNDIDINSGNTNNTNNTNSSNSSNSSTFNINNPNTIGAIVGGVVGCLALICIAVVLVIWLRRRYRKEKKEAESESGSGSGSTSKSSSSSSSSSSFPFSPNPSIKDMIDQTGGDYILPLPKDGAKEVEALPPKYPILTYANVREVRQYPPLPVYEIQNTEYRRGGGGGWMPSNGPRELPGGRSPKELSDNSFWVQNMPPVELPAGSIYWKRSQSSREGVPF